MQTKAPVLPAHVGFIVDGNRRWAKKHGLPVYEGHLAGYSVIKEISRAAVEQGVKFVSFYVFSTENWKRSQDEVKYLMKLVLKILTDDVKELIKEQVKVRILGSRDGVSQPILSAISQAEADTAHFTRATVAFCFNYGGQLEIAEAATQCLKDGLKDITPQDISQRLYDPEIPDVDLLVRTSGEQRISNFMLWRAAYSELLFIKKLWPDLRPKDVEDILKEYTRRQRRFGGS
jgi:undecaprenyl diphosphate synthase